MNFHVLTTPEMIQNGMNTSITGRAINAGILFCRSGELSGIMLLTSIRKVDDYTYGGRC